LPTEAGTPDGVSQIAIAQPRPGRWDTPAFAEIPWHALADALRPPAGVSHSSHGRDATYERLRDEIDILATFSPTEAAATVRRTMLHTLSAHESEITQQLTWAIDQARVDRNEPASEISKLTIYILVSLAEETASAVAWPLATMLREAMGDYTPVEVVGFFQADSFAPPPFRLRESAGIYLALEEMANLETADQARQKAIRADLPHSQWLASLGERPFDHRYLLSREKIGGTMASSESEIIAMVGNALEAFLLSDADRFLSERLAPDLPFLHERDGYSSLGAATIYVPVEVMRARSRDQIRAQLLRDQFLAPLTTEQAEQVEQLAQTMAQDILSVSELEQALVEGTPFEIDDQPRPTRSRRGGARGPFAPLRLRLSELQPPLSGIEEMGPTLRVEAIEHHLAHLEGARLPRWRQELLIRAGVVPTPTMAEDAEGAQEPPQAPLPGQTAINYLLGRMDESLLALVREGGRGGLRIALESAERTAALIRRDRDGLSAQRSRLAIPPALRNQRGSAEVNRLQGAIDRWISLHKHPGWVFLGLIVACLVAVTAIARATGAGPGQLQATGLLRLVIGAAVAGALAAVTLLLLTRRRLEKLSDRMIQARGAIINRQINDLVYDLAVNAHNSLCEKTQERADYLRRTLGELTLEHSQLATALARPMTATSSFVRTAVLDTAIYDGIWARARRWASGGIAPNLWTNGHGRPDELKSAWRDTLDGITTEPTLEQLEVRPALSWSDHTGARTPLTEVVSAAIARYAAVVSKPYLPPGASVESSLLRLAQKNGGEAGATGWQLDDLCLRARPFIGFEETETDRDTLVTIDLAAVPHRMSQWIGRETGAALRVHPVPSSDPFSITVVRTLHGLLAESLPQLRHYANAFAGMSEEARSRLLISPLLAGEPLPEPEKPQTATENVEAVAPAANAATTSATDLAGEIPPQSEP
jgi:hypothetical protein